MIERITMDVVAMPAEAEAASDEEPGPSPAGVMVLHDAWLDIPGAEAAVHDAVNATILLVPAIATSEIAIALSSDAAVRELNALYRDQDKPTNVLSFPAAAGPADDAGDASGDIVIALETVQRESATEDKHLLHHLAHLTVHGLLHLAGYDHDTDTEAEEMEALERRILASLEIPDPYRSDVEERQPFAG